MNKVIDDRIINNNKQIEIVNNKIESIDKTIQKVKRKRTGGKLGSVNLSLDWNTKRYCDDFGNIFCDPKKAEQLRKDGNDRLHSITHFPKYTHDGWWDIKGKTICQYNEIYAIRGKNGEVEKKRHYKHNLVIPDKEKIMEKIVGNYFKLIEIVKTHGGNK